MKIAKLIVLFVSFVSIAHTVQAQDYMASYDSEKLVALECLNVCMEEQACDDFDNSPSLQCVDSYNNCEVSCSYSKL